MKGTFVLAGLISSISLCRAAPFQVRSEDDKNNIIKLPLRKRDVQGKAVRRDVSGDLEHDGHRYLVDLDIGTPPQTLTLSIDTGSSDTWVYGAGSCDACVGGVCKFRPELLLKSAYPYQSIRRYPRQAYTWKTSDLSKSPTWTTTQLVDIMYKTLLV